MPRYSVELIIDTDIRKADTVNTELTELLKDSWNFNRFDILVIKELKTGKKDLTSLLDNVET